MFPTRGLSHPVSVPRTKLGRDGVGDLRNGLTEKVRHTPRSVDRVSLSVEDGETSGYGSTRRRSPKDPCTCTAVDGRVEGHLSPYGPDGTRGDSPKGSYPCLSDTCPGSNWFSHSCTQRPVDPDVKGSGRVEDILVQALTVPKTKIPLGT